MPSADSFLFASLISACYGTTVHYFFLARYTLHDDFIFILLVDPSKCGAVWAQRIGGLQVKT